MQTVPLRSTGTSHRIDDDVDSGHDDDSDKPHPQAPGRVHIGDGLVHSRRVVTVGSLQGSVVQRKRLAKFAAAPWERRRDGNMG